MNFEGPYNAPPGFVKSPKGKLIPLPIIVYPNYQSLKVARQQVKWLKETADYLSNINLSLAIQYYSLSEEIEYNIHSLAF